MFQCSEVISLASKRAINRLLKSLKKRRLFIALLHISLRWHDPDQVQRVFSQLLSK
jgi:hypothetical protein